MGQWYVEPDLLDEKRNLPVTTADSRPSMKSLGIEILTNVSSVAAV